MQEYQRRTSRKFVAYSEVLAVAHALGWRRVAEPGPLPKGPMRAE
jgi:hypothetical protein